MMYWINSGYKCQVSDRGAHFFDRRPVLCNKKKNIYHGFLCAYHLAPASKGHKWRVLIFLYLSHMKYGICLLYRLLSRCQCQTDTALPLQPRRLDAGDMYAGVQA